MPETHKIPLALIVEPSLVMRIGFNEIKMEELITSMRGTGLINDICVTPLFEAAPEVENAPEGTVSQAPPRATGRFEILAGHRRFVAAQALGWEEIQCKVFQPGERMGEEVKAQENFIREDISDFAAGNYFMELSERPGMTEERLRVIAGRPLSYVYDCMKLVKGDVFVGEAVHRGDITLAVAKVLNKCSDEAHRRYLLKLATDTGTTARQAEGWLRDWQVQEGLRPPTAEPVATAPLPPVQPGNVFICALCGGDKDPYNLECVYIHRAELASLKAALRVQEGA